MGLRVASYNVRKAVGLDRQRDPARILRVLQQIDADIVALQEADRRLGARPTALPRFLIEQETDYQVAHVAVNDVSLGWHGNAILVRRGLEVLGTDRLPLPGLEPRGAVLARIGGTGIGPVTVVGAHLGLLRSYRRKQLHALRAHLDDAGTDRTVLMGDFNEWSPVSGLEPIDGALRVVAPGRSFHAARPVAALDRIAHGPALRVAKAGVDTSALARQASDHLPIWADIVQSAE